MIDELIKEIKELNIEQKKAVLEFIVKKINIEVDSEECKGLYLLCSSQMMKVVGDEDFGRSVFFTKEEAKRALKGDVGK